MIEKQNRNRKRGIWRTDKTQDIFDITDNRIRRNAHSVAAVCMKNNLLNTGDGFHELRVKNYGKTYNLSANERFYNQPVAAGFMCTGVLVAKDVIVTAAHFADKTNVKQMCFIFGYAMVDPITAVTKIPDDKIYRGIEILQWKYDVRGPNAAGSDWTFVKLDRKVEGQEIAVLSKRSVVNDQPIYALGHSCGLPVKFASGSVVQNIEKAYFMVDARLYSGNSGSPVFCEETHEMVGMVSRSYCKDFRWTEDGFVSVIYPNEEIASEGVRCIKVAEFNDFFPQLKGTLDREKKSDMPSIFDVTIEPAGGENLFRITWYDVQTKKRNSFTNKADFLPEEIMKLWNKKDYQLTMGQKLFRFLDGEHRYFKRVLDQANQKSELFQINLHTCRQIDDLPFELLAAENTYLLPLRLHLVRCVSGGGIEKAIPPVDRPLKLLFMASSPTDIESLLDFEQEVESIFNITKHVPIIIEVEDSGSLEGLKSRLLKEQFDVVHLSGHASIDGEGKSFIYMETDTGGISRVSPEMLWNKALIGNPPKLLFLSASYTGGAVKSVDKNYSESFARLMVEFYKVPAALWWGGDVSDTQAIYGEKIIYKELGHGRSILSAIQRARYKLIKAFPGIQKPAWPLLRLYASGIPINALITKEQHWYPKSQSMTHIYLSNSKIKVLSEGFVGRRQQLQLSLQTLEWGDDKLGVLLLGTGGLGKSCLAGKICERLSDYTLIIIHGRLNTISMEVALKNAFITSQDKNGQRILSQKTGIADKLAHLCATSFKERKYLFLLDGFEQNLEGATNGQPGLLMPEARKLVRTLLYYLAYSGKMSKMIITSRYEFSLVERNNGLVKKRLEKIWLTSFQESEQLKKAKWLTYISALPELSMVKELLAAGCGNPRLMEWIDVLVGRMKTSEVPILFEAILSKKEEFVRQHVIRELLRYGGDQLAYLLSQLSIYSKPVTESQVLSETKVTDLEQWKKLLREGMRLSLLEYDQARKTYQVTPLLKDELQENSGRFRANSLEDKLRNKVAKGKFAEVKNLLNQIIKISHEREEQLRMEFGFIDEDEIKRKKKEDQIDWRRKVWCILSARNNFEIISPENKVDTKNIEKKTSEPLVEVEINDSEADEKNRVEKSKIPGQKGEELEQAVLRLFEKFFDICELEETFQTISARQQDRGRQSGYDLKFVVGTTGNRKLRILIECKHYSKKIKLGDIAGKLIAAKSYSKNVTPIDHWLLVSPNAKLSNELDDLLEEWEKDKENPEYPFKVQALIKDVRVKEFFGLIPGIYDNIIKKPDLEIHPKDWNEKKRQAVIDFWKEKLEPPLRLPKGWGEYLRNSGKFLRQVSHWS